MFGFRALQWRVCGVVRAGHVVRRKASASLPGPRRPRRVSPPPLQPHPTSLQPTFPVTRPFRIGPTLPQGPYRFRCGARRCKRSISKEVLIDTIVLRWEGPQKRDCLLREYRLRTRGGIDFWNLLLKLLLFKFPQESATIILSQIWPSIWNVLA